MVDSFDHLIQCEGERRILVTRNHTANPDRIAHLNESQPSPFVLDTFGSQVGSHPEDVYRTTKANPMGTVSFFHEKFFPRVLTTLASVCKKRRFGHREGPATARWTRHGSQHLS